jgi:XRE family transcriptional regulator, regulator of sulfur utilization
MADHVGERLKRIRLARGLSVRALAQLAQIPPSTISEVERGARSGANLTLETGRRFARALGVSLDVIAGVYEDSSDACGGTFSS